MCSVCGCKAFPNFVESKLTYTSSSLPSSLNSLLGAGKFRFYRSFIPDCFCLPVYQTVSVLVYSVLFRCILICFCSSIYQTVSVQVYIPNCFCSGVNQTVLLRYISYCSVQVYTRLFCSGVYQTVSVYLYISDCYYYGVHTRLFLFRCIPSCFCSGVYTRLFLFRFIPDCSVQVYTRLFCSGIYQTV